MPRVESRYEPDPDEQVRRRELLKKNDDISREPGISVLLTPEAFTSLITFVGQHDDYPLITDEQVEMLDTGAVRVTFERGVYQVGGHGVRFHLYVGESWETERFNSAKHEYWLPYPRVISVKGISAGESWQNFDFNENGIPRRAIKRQ